VVLAILVFLVVLVLRARKRAAEAVEPQPAAAPPATEEGPAGEDASSPTAHQLRQSFRRGVGRLGGFLTLRADRYRVPWIALVGQTGSRPADLLADAGLGFPLGRPHAGELTSQAGCRWWFFDRGAVLDLAGEYVLRADGVSADERGWRTFLRLLQRHRPKRPLDAFVVTVGCGDLLGAGRDAPDRLAAVEQTACGLYARLWEAQKTLGMRCPIYLLVTGCDAIPGFEGFATQLPEGLRRGLFGWSSPYEVDRGYQARWLDEAYECLRGRLLQAQVRIFGAERPLAAQDDVFVFPGGLEALREPLRIFLNQLFKPSVYHQPMYFRGLYLCGAVDGGAGAATAAAGPVHGTLFLKDLFERKVFPEAQLAAPTPATLVARNRRVRLAQGLVAAGALVLALGTGWGYRDLRQRETALKPYLEDTARDLVGVQAGAAVEPYALEERSFRVFENLTRIDARPYVSAFLPSSWISDFDHDLLDSFVRAYDRIVFTSLGMRLRERATRVLAGADSREPAMDPSAGAFAKTSLGDQPAFVRLQRFVADLGTLERHARAYNDIAESRSLDDLAGLVDYLFARPLPADFFENAGLYRDALREVRQEKFDFAAFVPAATAQAHRLAEDLYWSLFLRSDLAATLEELGRELGGLGRDPWTRPESFRRVVELTGAAEVALSQPGYQWVFRDVFDLGPEYRELLGRIAESPFLGAAGAPGGESDLAASLRRRGEQEWVELRRRLAGLESPYTGPLLERRDGEPRMQLSPDLLVVEAALADFLGQNFMVAEPPGGHAAPVPAGAQVRWDGDLLAQATEQFESFRRFRDRGLTLFPPELRPSIELLARRRVGEHTWDLIARAQTVVAPAEQAGVLVEDRLAADVASYRRDGDLFRRLLEIFAELRLREDHDRLADLFAEEGVRLLRSVDAVVDRRGLYLPRGAEVDGWEGEGNLALRSFDVDDEAELQAFLDAQRSRIQALALDYAQPLISVLADLGATHQRGARSLIARWDGILADLADYRDKKPGSRLGSLESLVVTELPKIALDRCPTAGAAVAADATRFFASREAALRDAVARRCRTLAAQRAVASYRRIENFFNQRLAGRFPFAADGDAGPAPEAGAETVREFFRLFDAEAGALGALRAGSAEPSPAALPASPPASAPAAPPVGPGPRPAAGREADGDRCPFRRADGEVLGRESLDFLCELHEVRDFLAPYLDAREPVEKPTFDLEVEFRVNRRHERLGDQIIDWAVDVGDRRIGHLDPQPAGRWSLGAPIQVTLRWASGSPWTPVAERERPEVEVRDRTAVYRYPNLWSLVSLVNAHRSSPADLDGFDDLRPHTLRFSVPARREPGEVEDGEAPAGGAVEAETRVFIRLSLVAPESKRPLVVPSFPREAPRLPELEARAR
jgi:type VI secretion system protein ImpL